MRLTEIQIEAAEVLVALEALPSRVDAFLAETGCSETRFGREALKDPGFVKKLREGRLIEGVRRPMSPSVETVRRVLTYMRDWRG